MEGMVQVGWNIHTKPLSRTSNGVNGVNVLTFGGPLLTVSLHRHMGIQVIQRSVSLLTSIPTALIHALNFLIPSSRSLVLLGARNRDE